MLQDIVLLTKKIVVGIVLVLVPFLIFYYGLKLIQHAF
jgi:hypothetical protein